MKKIMALLLAAIMIFSFTGCGKKTTIKETDLSKPITIHWIMPGPGKQGDSEKVWAKFNEELHKRKGFENVTVKIEVIPFADYQQKFLLMQTSDEPMDVVQTYSLDYANEFRNGSFIDMTDYMGFAKESLSQIPEWVAEMGKVDGQQAIIPNYQKMASAPWAFTMPKDLADKYADVKKMTETFQNADYIDQSCIDVVEDYVKKVNDAGKLGTGFTSFSAKGFEKVINAYGFKTNEKDIKIENNHFNGIYSTIWKAKNDFYKKGYVRKDTMSAKAEESNGVVGGNVNWSTQAWTTPEPSVDDKTYDTMSVVKIPYSKRYYIPAQPAAGGIAISATSQYPDVAMKLIDLMQSKSGIELYNLLVYGIEGEHYDIIKTLKDGDKVIKPKDYVEEGTSSSEYGLPKWVVGNAKNAYLTDNLPEDFKEFIYNYMNEGKDTDISKLMGFAINADTIETKLSQIASVSKEYGDVLGKGAVEFQPYYEEYQKKAELAGNTEVITEIQKQVDEFLATKK